jgi:hypothetical protein
VTCPPDCEKYPPDPLWRTIRGPVFSRHDMPDMLRAIYFESPEPLDGKRLGRLIDEAWTSDDHPTWSLDIPTWWEMFMAAGFVTDCRRLRRPRKARTLWRGCQPGFERGMSWTDNYDQAVWFARWREASLGPGVIVSAVVPADMVLARFVHGRKEAEWVLDPYELENLEISVTTS